MRVDDRLTDAGRRVRSAIDRLPGMEAKHVQRRLQRRRLKQAMAGTGSVLALLVATALLLPPEPQESLGTSAHRVTFDDYENAYIEVANCLRDAGYRVEGPFRFGRDPEASLGLGFGGLLGDNPTLRLDIRRIFQEGEDAAEVDRIWGQCERDANLQAIESEWLKVNEPTLLPFDVWVENLLTCMRDRGLAIPEYVDLESVASGPWPEGVRDWEPAHHWIQGNAGVAILELGCTPWES